MAEPSTRLALAALAACLAIGAGEPGQPPGDEAPSGVEPAAGGGDAVVYRPPRLGAPRARVGGGVRGARALPTPLALAPDHVGLTARAAPSLFWHLDGVASERRGLSLVLTLIEAEGVEPLLEVPLRPPPAAGIQRVRLADHGVGLRPDVEYEWSVSMARGAEPRVQDLVSTGYLMRVDEPRLAEPADPARYADLGLWYDALEGLSDAIDARPGDAGLRAARNALLRQAGLEAAVE